MIVRINGEYYKHSDFPNTDWFDETDRVGNFIIDETTEAGELLAKKVEQNAPYIELVIEDEQVVDVLLLPKPPVPTPEKTPDQIRIEQLEDESAMLTLELINTQIRLEQAETEQANLLLELVGKGVL